MTGTLVHFLLESRFDFGLVIAVLEYYRVFEKNGVKLVVDNVSYDLVKGATIDYEEELIRAAFVVKPSFFLFASFQGL